jgi:hypothetical protein
MNIKPVIFFGRPLSGATMRRDCDSEPFAVAWRDRFLGFAEDNSEALELVMRELERIANL